MRRVVLVAAVLVGVWAFPAPEGDEGLESFLQRAKAEVVPPEDNVNMQVCAGGSMGECLTIGSDCLWCESSEEEDKDAPSVCVSMDQMLQFPAMMRYSCTSAPAATKKADVAQPVQGDNEEMARTPPPDTTTCKTKFTDEASCNEESACTWCTSETMDAGMCVALYDAARFPPSVFVCDNDVEALNELIQTAGPLSWLLGGGGDPTQEEDEVVDDAVVAAPAPTEEKSSVEVPQVNINDVVEDSLSCSERFDDQVSCERVSTCVWCVHEGSSRCFDASVASDMGITKCGELTAMKELDTQDADDDEVDDATMEVLQAQGSQEEGSSDEEDNDDEDDGVDMNEEGNFNAAQASDDILHAMNQEPEELASMPLPGTETDVALAAMNAPADDKDVEEGEQPCQGIERGACSGMEGCVWCTGLTTEVPSLCSPMSAAVSLPQELFVCGEPNEADMNTGQTMGIPAAESPDAVVAIMNGLQDGQDLERLEEDSEVKMERLRAADPQAKLISTKDMTQLMNKAVSVMEQVQTADDHIHTTLEEMMNSNGDDDDDAPSSVPPSPLTPNTADPDAPVNFDDDAGPFVFALPLRPMFEMQSNRGGGDEPEVAVGVESESVQDRLMRAAGEAMHFQQDLEKQLLNVRERELAMEAMEESEDTLRQQEMEKDAAKLMEMVRLSASNAQDEQVGEVEAELMKLEEVASNQAEEVEVESIDTDTKALEEAFHQLPNEQQKAEEMAAQAELEKLFRLDDTPAPAPATEANDVNTKMVVSGQVGTGHVQNGVTTVEVPVVKGEEEQMLAQLATGDADLHDEVMPQVNGGEEDAGVPSPAQDTFKVSADFTMNLPNDDDFDEGADEVAAFMNGEVNAAAAESAKLAQDTHAVDEAAEGLLSMALSMDEAPLLSSCANAERMAEMHAAFEEFTGHMGTAAKLVESIEALAALGKGLSVLLEAAEKCGIDEHKRNMLQHLVEKVTAPDDVKFKPSQSLRINGVEILHGVETAAADWRRSLYGGFGFKMGRTLGLLLHPSHGHHARAGGQTLAPNESLFL